METEISLIKPTPASVEELRALFQRFFPKAACCNDGETMRIYVPFPSPDMDMPKMQFNLCAFPPASQADVEAGQFPRRTCRLFVTFVDARGRIMSDPANDKALDLDFDYFRTLRRIAEMDPTILIFDTDTWDRERFIRNLSEALAAYNVFLTRWSNV